MHPPSTSKAEYWMQEAMRTALRAQDFGERPFGAVVVDQNDSEVTRAGGTGLPGDPLRHSECVAITEACRLNKGLLEGWSLYSTHEPCHMCAGAILHAHLSFVAWGSERADLPQLFRGYEVSTYDILRDSSHAPKTLVVMNTECVHLFDGELSELANRRAGF